MSSDSLLRTPKSKVDREVVSRSPGLFANARDGEYFKKEDFVKRSYQAMDYIFFPWNQPDYNPGILSSVHVFVMVLLGSLLNGWFGLQPLSNAIAAGTDPFITSIVLALLQGSLFFLASYWTYEQHLPTLVYPEITLASVGTSRLGIVPVAIYLVVQYGSYGLAGYFLRLTNGFGPAGISNVATTGASYAFYWFGAVVITFNWIYNYEFVMTSEKYRPFKVHTRAALCTALSIAVLVLAFYSFGLRVFSSGLYITSWVFRNTDAAGAYVTSAVPAPWAFYWFGGLFGGAITAWILYMLINVLVSWRYKSDRSVAFTTGDYGTRMEEAGPEMSTMGSNIPYTSMNNNVSRRGLKEAINMDD